MASTTPNFQLPYPQSSDAANPPTDFLNLASKLDNVITGYHIGPSTDTFTAFAGLLWYQTDTKKVYMYTSPTANALLIDPTPAPYIAVYLTTPQSTTSGTTGVTTVGYNGYIGSALGGSTAPTLGGGVVTVSRPGLYRINAVVEIPNSIDSVALRIDAGGVSYGGGAGQLFGGTQNPRMTFSADIPLAGTNTVATKVVWSNAAGSWNVHGGTSPYCTYMTVAYAGPTS